MADQPKRLSLKDIVLEEIADELLSLEGEELEQFLAEYEEDAGQALELHRRAIEGARSSLGRAQLDAAKAHLQRRSAAKTAMVFTLDTSKKRALVASIEKKAQATGEMTMAARNRRTNPDDDIDAILEAYLELGLVDENGELKG